MKLVYESIEDFLKPKDENEINKVFTNIKIWQGFIEGKMSLEAVSIFTSPSKLKEISNQLDIDVPIKTRLDKRLLWVTYIIKYKPHLTLGGDEGEGIEIEIELWKKGKNPSRNTAETIQHYINRTYTKANRDYLRLMKKNLRD